MSHEYRTNGFWQTLARRVIYVVMRTIRRLDKTETTEFRPGSPDDPANTLYGRLIKKYAEGRSFADICCMWGMHAAVSYYAEEHGAARVTAFDGMDPTPECMAEHKKRNSRVKFSKGNIDDRNLLAQVGMHDVVWCTGLLYHTPEPFRIISDVLSIAGEYAIFGSKTIPEVAGMPNTSVFLPGYDQRERNIFHPFWGKNVKRVFGTLPNWSAEWWWLLSGSTIAAMIEVHPGWRVVAIHNRTRTKMGFNDNCMVVAQRVPAVAARLAPAVASESSLMAA